MILLLHSALVWVSDSLVHAAAYVFFCRIVVSLRGRGVRAEMNARMHSST